jgi:hypothetical protein
MYTPIQDFEMEMQLKMNTISGMPSKKQTIVKPAKHVHVYKVILYLLIITVKAFVEISVLLVISGKL